jgi:transposase
VYRGNRLFFNDERRAKVAPRPLDKVMCGERNVIERWFGRLTIFRRVATPHEKTALSYLGMVATPVCLLTITGWAGA